MADELNMDIISMVQKARMMNDAQAKPSEISAVYWIECKAPVQNPTPRAAALVIPTTVDEVDALWEKIKTATEAGKLGYKSKVSTAPGKDQGLASARTVHVRIADSENQADVQRVRDALRELGITDDIALVPDKG